MTGHGDVAELRAEFASCLLPMIQRLSPDHRDAITLVEIKGMTQQAAATQMGIPLSSMKSRVQRGRKHLKHMLDDCCCIELDRRGGVVDYRPRTTDCAPCTDRESSDTAETP
ncbi:MAG: sigma factor-like helix-turn-helix DNA-binding protein [Nitrospiraceae bacterium]